MIIDAKTIIITLALVGIAGYFGLQLIRSFALSIAQENHDANLAVDMSVEAKRARREQEADAAAMAAFAKVEPLLPASVVNKGMSLKSKAAKPAAPSSGGLQAPLVSKQMPTETNQTTVVDEEAPAEPLISDDVEVGEEIQTEQPAATEIVDEEVASAEQLIDLDDNPER
jgi:hypothetical protein